MTTKQRNRPARGAAIAAVLTAALTLGAGRASAQYFTPGIYTNYRQGIYEGGTVGTPYGFGYGGLGYGGWGYGGYGGGYGYGGYGGGYGYGTYGFGSPYLFGGVSPYDVAMMRQQRYALNASRYNLMNAKTATAYQAANLFRAEALNQTVEAYRKAKGSPGDGSRYDPKSGQPYRADSGPAPIPMEKIIAKDGSVIWPLGAPEEGDLAAKKQAAGQAIQEVARDALEEKPASPSRVINARQALADYANPAADWFEEHSAKDLPGFVNYIRSLDRGLRSLVQAGGKTPSPAEEIGGINVDPDGTARTGGDVLLKQIREQDGRPASPKPE